MSTATTRLGVLISCLNTAIENYLGNNFRKYYHQAKSEHSNTIDIYNKTIKLVRARQQRSNNEWYLWFKESAKHSYPYHRCDDMDKLIQMLDDLIDNEKSILKHYELLNRLKEVNKDNLNENVNHDSYTKIERLLKELSKDLKVIERNARNKWTDYSSLAEDIQSLILMNKYIDIASLTDTLHAELSQIVVDINKKRNDYSNNLEVNPETEQLRKVNILLAQKLEIAVEAANAHSIELYGYQKFIGSLSY